MEIINFKATKTEELKAIRDGLRVFDSEVSIELWTRQKRGEDVFNSGYVPDERLKHYEDREERYKGYLINYGFTKVIDWISDFVPFNLIRILRIILGI